MTQDNALGTPPDLTPDEAAYLAAVMAAGTDPKPRSDWRDFARKVHFTELQPYRPGDPLGPAWDTFRREVGRLLAEGHAGKFVLVRGDEVVGLWDTSQAADDEAVRRFPGERVLIREVSEYYPIIRLGRAEAWLR